ncbi:MAG TPA: hypothetical protein VEK08_10095 [Planctomycetota bacterium]|nr:hypothetical protein [Planctomycetota bacterium]
MAVTNQPRTQLKLPLWAQRSKLRLDLLGEALSNRIAKDLIRKKFTAVIISWEQFTALRTCTETQSALALLKKKKIKLIASMNFDSYNHDALLRLTPTAEQWMKRDERGALAKTLNGSMVFADVTHCGWQNFVRAQMLAAIDEGFDGIWFTPLHADEEQGIAFLNALQASAKGSLGERYSEFIFCGRPQIDSPIAAHFPVIIDPAGMKPGFSSDTVLRTNLGELKFLYELNGRDTTSAKGFYAGELSPRELANAAAEILASGGTFADQRTPENFLAFHADAASRLAGSQPIGSVGLIMNSDAVYASSVYTSLLARANIQYDVIPAHQIDNFDLKKYGLLSTLFLESPSSELKMMLQHFTERGGTWLESLEAEEPVRRFEKLLGKGRVIAYRVPALSAMDADLSSITPFLVETVLPDIAAHCGPQPILVNAPDGVIALLWGKGTRRWVHVLNYRSEHSSATITLPECGGRTLEVFSPDVKPPELKVIDTGNARCVFELNGLETYAIVEIV